MKFAICQVSVAPLRAESSDQSEMVSQILFGEKVNILESKKNWVKIKAEFDGYEGWADSKQFLEISEEEFNSIRIEKYASESFNLAVEKDNPVTLPMAVSLPNLENGKIKFGSLEMEYLGEFFSGKLEKSTIPDLALLFLNTPYLWGGKSVFGIDCSGLVQQVYKFSGIKLPRDAYQQAEIGHALSFVEEAEPGDLAFFDNPEGKIIHVGIILEENKIIHAHGKVRIDPMDSTGIFNTDSQMYSHKLRVIKQIL
ncbi:C40 family peptidase [Moheibacter lacus]|uniref:C40 family peptidase n=1 Tax=Moheibacter lacus TaxID=2745851 RepID=A0A838ZNH9_9FLAO|nr:C40 family peptidase [Moheibacter lacus]MBA5629510.1 C40 family peptidase [Moheibacter lacus]